MGIENLVLHHTLLMQSDATMHNVSVLHGDTYLAMDLEYECKLTLMI